MIERVSAAYASRAYDEGAWAAAGRSPATAAPVRFDGVLAAVMAASFTPPVSVGFRPGPRQAGGQKVNRG